MTLTNNQAIKIATMMLQAATYEAPFMTLHPIVTRKDGRQETYQAIAKALSVLTGINAPYIIGQLIVSNGNSDMVFDELPDGVAAHLQSEYQNAPVYQDGKGRQYIMFEGVRTQDYCYQVIDVARYVDFAPTGKYRNIHILRKRIQRNSDAIGPDRLEDSGKKEDIKPLTIQHLQTFKNEEGIIICVKCGWIAVDIPTVMNIKDAEYRGTSTRYIEGNPFSYYDIALNGICILHILRCSLDTISGGTILPFFFDKYPF